MVRQSLPLGPLFLDQNTVRIAIGGSGKLGGPHTIFRLGGRTPYRTRRLMLCCATDTAELPRPIGDQDEGA